MTRASTSDWQISLGQPDYLTLTTGIPALALLFPFWETHLERSVRELVDVDWGRPAGEAVCSSMQLPDHTWAEKSGLDLENLVALLERYHSHSLPADSPQLENWKWLYQSTWNLVGGGTERAWEVVCVGLLQRPDFYSY